MLRYIIIFHLVVSFFVCPAFASNDLSNILDGIRNKYGHLPGLSVTYTREVITRSMSMLGGQVKGDLATGRIYFKPSHYMRLEQETPRSETIIYNGDTLWWYIPDKKCVYKYPAQQFGQELRFLSNVFGGLG
ncbi:MAG: outer membrane lipoprotein carrier protein LolA, partial [Desulfobacteraceae bacterium]|nr:outer membrane lipoprotein carrier protein LolA [Desulfobacteraceae bacterium]